MVERTGKYYTEGEERAKRVTALFSRIAPRYDLINDAQSLGLHRIWKRRLVRLTDVPDEGSALDLCCGTGDLVQALARAYPRAGRIAGLDFTMPMLRIAAARIEEDGTSGANASATNLEPSAPPAAIRSPESERHSGRPGGAGRSGPDVVLLQADALCLPVASASFDRVTIGYGLRNVADVEGCVAEARRVLRPGGKFLILEFGKPESPLVSRLYLAYLRAAVPVFGRIFFGDRDTHGYIYDSLARFPSQREVTGILRAGGFRTVALHDVLFGIMAIHVAEV